MNGIFCTKEHEVYNFLVCKDAAFIASNTKRTEKRTYHLSDNSTEIDRLFCLEKTHISGIN